MKVHICQSVEGALKNWSKKEWKNMALANDCSVKDCKDFFLKCLKDGKQVIPIGDCDNFSYQDGCLGHE